MVQLPHPYVNYLTTWKTIALTRQTFVGQAISLLFNILSGFVIAFLPRSKILLISWLQSLYAIIWEPKKIKSVTASTFSPSIYHEVIGPATKVLVFEYWVLSQLFHFPLSPSSSGSLIPLHFVPLELVSSVYLMLLIFLLAILIPTCASSSLAFCMMYSA